MKKRSVLSAVAMLLVSALVLTSATYAWFASTSTANVNNVSANVTTADGSLLVSAQNGSGTWCSFRPSITTSELPEFPSYLMPVSLDVSALKAVSTYKVSYDGANFTTGGAGTANGASGDFINYNLQVQYKTNSTTAKDINMTPTFARTSNFTYGLVRVTYDGTTTCYLFDGSGETVQYVPVTAIAAGQSIADDKLDALKIEGVIDSTDDNYAAATMGSAIDTNTTAATTATDITIMNDAASAAGAMTTLTATISVYLWAEGQDADCVGGASSGNISLSLAFGAV